LREIRRMLRWDVVSDTIPQAKDPARVAGHPPGIKNFTSFRSASNQARRADAYGPELGSALPNLGHLASCAAIPRSCCRYPTRLFTGHTGAAPPP
jgi:hypothetical protein